METFKIYTLGCKVNQYDSQVLREQLQRAGLRELNNGQKSDYYIINTCTVTNSADRQSRYLIRKAKRDNPLAKIVATGCYAHANANEIRKIKGVDLILDNDNKYRISELLFPGREINISASLGVNNFKAHTRAFVKIQDGCDNFCSFCKVPYARGRSRSRDFVSIIEEIKRLSGNGYKEIVLTGICLGDYGRDSSKKTDSPRTKRVQGLVDLIERIEEIEGILRIRLSSIEAKDVSDSLIRKMKESAKLCPHLHIPFQSGDNSILKLMNRRDRTEDYLALVEKLKKNIKDFAISTDIMIGFPREDDKRFSNTLDFLKKIEPARVHIFTFTPRDNTPLADFKNNITQYALRERFSLLKALADQLSLRFKRKFLNRNLSVLFEGKKNGFWRGYSENYLLSYLKTDNNLNLINKFKKVKVETITDSILYVKLCRNYK